MNQEPQVLGDWMREKNLGSGGFGIVTLWKNIRTNEKIAIKSYRGDPGSNLTKKHKERWAKEVEMMQKIDNENIVKFYKLPEEFASELHRCNSSSLPMLSMEYCSKGDLRGILGEAGNCCGLPESDVRYILSDLMNAVSYLHELKITHRDLKPENIVLQLCDRPNQIVYKLIDLGYAKEIDAQSVSASFVGTLQYLAPEFLYSKTYSCSVDYWSMGLVAFEIICGMRPFLPNMSPAQWLPHVQKKSPDTITIYQEVNDEIVDSSEIFPENHASSCFKQEVERWLRLAVEFHPKKRGYVDYDPTKPDNELQIFTALRTLLDKKILTVFSVFGCEHRSYEIDEFTCVSTLQGWIERDTKIPKSEQLLLSGYGDKFDGDDLAKNYFDPTYKLPMTYLFKRSEMLQEELPASPPKLVRQLLENPKNKMPYYFQKKSCAHALYFIYKQDSLYNTVLEASNVRVRHMLKVLGAAHELRQEVTTRINRLSAQRAFSKLVLDFDYKQYLNNYSQDATHWTGSFELLSQKVDKLAEVANYLAERCVSVTRRVGLVSNTAEKDYSKYSLHELNKLFESALSCYDKVRMKSKRSQPDNCLDMVLILYNVLKARDKLLMDIHFKQHLRIIVQTDLELEKMMIPLKGIIQHIDKCGQDLLADHLARQKKIWDFTIKQKPKSVVSSPESVRSIEIVKSQSASQPESAGKAQKPTFILGNPNIPKTDIGEPLSLTKPLDFILGGEVNNASFESNSSYASHNSNPKPRDEKLQKSAIPPSLLLLEQPAESIIDENQNLRLELEERNNESFQYIKSILSHNLDFSFLEE